MVIVNSILLFRVIIANGQINTSSYPAVALANDMELAITQVQQYLSDISATRAQDGKDDGFDNAEENAKKFKEALKKFALLRPEKANYIKEYEKAFDEYYKLGKAMAQAYITYGPVEGNKLMPEFDDKADRLSEYTQQIREESEQEMDRDLEKVNFETKLVLAIIITSGLVTIILSLFITRLISNALGVIMNSAQKSNDGYITIQEIPLHSKDEFGELARILNILLSQVKGFITQVSISAEQLTCASEELTFNLEQSAQATNQMTTSITKVSEGTEKEADSVSGVSRTIQGMLAGIQQAAGSANVVTGSSGKTAKAAEMCGKSIEEAITQMRNIEKTVSNSANIVMKLGERSKEIDQIVETISLIAGQTNLLALNAAIEAARAGEHGRGFAVVADEVRKLAEQSEVAAKQVSNLIREIQSETNIAVGAMDEGMQEVKLGTNVVNAAGSGFDEIASLVNEMSQQVMGIAGSIQQIAGGSQQVAVSIITVEEISKDMAEQTQSVSTATELQSASMAEIACSSQRLASMAQELKHAISSFKI